MYKFHLSPATVITPNVLFKYKCIFLFNTSNAIDDIHTTII